MALCQRCHSDRVAAILARCSDMCRVELDDQLWSGYVPRDLGIGGGDDLQFAYCLDCGQIQGKFPVLPTGMVVGHGV